MICYIVTREENGRTAVWSPRTQLTDALAMIASHVKHRCARHDRLQRCVNFSLAPVVPGTRVRVGGSTNRPVWDDAPECVACVVHESELIASDGHRVLYRVTQHPIG